MSEVTLGRSTFRIGWLQIAIIVLTIVTACVHFYKGLSMLNPPSQGLHPGGPGGYSGGGYPGGGYPGGGHFGGRPGGAGSRGGGGIGMSLLAMLPIPLSVLFILNGIAYLVLLGALYLPALKSYQNSIRWLLILLAILTIIAYFLISGTRFNLLGYIDKPIEVALVILLLLDVRQAGRPRLT